MTHDAPPSSSDDHVRAAGRLLALGLRTSSFVSETLPVKHEQSGDLIGRYQLINLLGEGGFGIVWKALQQEPIQREVALKVIKHGLNSVEVVARFGMERQTLALMDHPNIASVFDAGTTNDGRPFFVMEAVNGVAVTDHCDVRQLSIRERVSLCIPICQAVQHAHQKAVLHRDIKPSNLLVTEINGLATPKVIDFGIAKALGGVGPMFGPGKMDQTRIGMIIGTPKYMSPEQAAGQDVDTRSDVYSLGVVLFELLTGRTPLVESSTDFGARLREVNDSEPVKPSTLVETMTPESIRAAACRKVDPARFARALRGDLDWIVLKALAKDREQRYQTATALAEDLQRYLRQETVSAVAPTWYYRFGKFARRHRAALIAASLAGLALIASTVVSLWQAKRAEQSRTEAEANFVRARNAVELYLSRITDHPRLKEGDFPDLQRSLLESALPFYQELSQNQSSDPKLRSDRAWAFGRLGDLYQNFDEIEKAIAAYRQAFEIEGDLIEQFPDEPKFRYEIALWHNNIGLMLRRVGKEKEGLIELVNALNFLEPLATRYPDVPEYSALVVTTLQNQTDALTVLNRFADAEAANQRVTALLNDALVRQPHNPSFLFELGKCKFALSNLYMVSGKPVNAENVTREVVHIYERLVEQDPDNRERRQMLAHACKNLGAILCGTGKMDEGDATLQRSVEISQQIANEVPHITSHRNAMIIAYSAMVLAFEKRGDVAKAEATTKKILDEQKELVNDFPHSRKYLEQLAVTLGSFGKYAKSRKEWTEARNLYQQAVAISPSEEIHYSLGEIAQSLGEHSAIAKHATQMLAAASPGWEARERAAKLFLNAYVLAAKDQQEDPQTRDTLAETYARQVVACLKEAVDQGLVGIAAHINSEEFSPLHNRSDFRALLNIPITLPAEIPHQFVFDYSGSDPGPRHWKREGLIWTETQPSGSQNAFEVYGTVVVKNIPGMLIKRRKGSMTLFVPNLGTAEPPMLRMRKSDGSWIPLGAITAVE